MSDAGLLLHSHVRQSLEGLLEGPQTLSQLSTMLGLKKPSLFPYLARLEALGVVRKEVARTRTGREARYHLLGATLHMEVSPSRGVALAWASPGEPEPRFPLLGQLARPEARAEVERALAAVEDRLRTRLEAVAPFVVLFGSFARGEETWKSDVDLLLVLDRPAARKRLQEAVAEAQEAADHPLRAHVTDRTGFLAGRRTVEVEAAREGIVLAARPGEDELWRRMARCRRIEP